MPLSDRAEKQVTSLLKDKLSALYTYHNFEHAREVVQAAEEIISATGMSGDEAEALRVAAWFHDTGYIHGSDDHERKSAMIFREFAHSQNVSEDMIRLVEKLILATNLQTEPQTPLEKVIRDADCYHFGHDNFTAVSQGLKTELGHTKGLYFTERQWLEKNRIAFTTWHRFYSDYAIRNWQAGKEKNLKEIDRKLQEMEDSEKPKKDKKEKKGERGIETLFRVTLSNHTQLSQIADSKANILLSVNAIIISIALSTLVPKLDSPTNAHLILPVFIMVLFSVASIIFAILSTRPKVHRYSYKPSDLEERKVNLLFFGNFNQIPLDDYLKAMEGLIRDPEYLYSSLIKDLYYLGKVLDRKYKLLRITYNIFMVGILISVLSFAYAFFSL